MNCPICWLDIKARIYKCSCAINAILRAISGYQPIGSWSMCYYVLRAVIEKRREAIGGVRRGHPRCSMFILEGSTLVPPGHRVGRSKNGLITDSKSACPSHLRSFMSLFRCSGGFPDGDRPKGRSEFRAFLRRRQLQDATSVGAPRG